MLLPYSADCPPRSIVDLLPQSFQTLTAIASANAVRRLSGLSDFITSNLGADSSNDGVSPIRDEWNSHLQIPGLT